MGNLPRLALCFRPDAQNRAHFRERPMKINVLKAAITASVLAIASAGAAQAQEYTFKLHHLLNGEICFKTQHISRVCSTKCINGLIVIAYGHDACATVR